MSNIHFAHPQYLYALLVALPLVLVFCYTSYWARLKARQLYGEEKLVGRFTRKINLALEIGSWIGWLVVAAAIVVAAAGPVKPDVPQRAQAGSLQVVTVMDVSWSMGAEDYRPYMTARDGTPGTAVVGPFGSRLDMTKHIITTQIMPAIPGNQIGIVTYMGDGFPQADLTDDYTALRFVFENWIVTGSAPGGGSDMAEGLNQALATFKRDEDPKKQKVIVLFSDGGSSSKPEDLDKVLNQIAQQNIRVIIVGVGLQNPIPIPVYDDNGQRTGYRQVNGQTATTAFEEPVLQHVATATNGTLLHVDETGKVNINWAVAVAGSKTEPRETQLFQYPLALGIGILLLLSLSGLARRKDLF